MTPLAEGTLLRAAGAAAAVDVDALAAGGVLALVERALGMAAFARGARVERLRRDLGLYLRQAAPDAKLARAAATLVADPDGIGALP